MARKKKTIENLSIHGIAEKGKAVGRTEDGQVVFVDHAVPGDVVNALILRKKKSFMHGVVTETKSYSKNRSEPFCKHFGNCGGCKWQDFAYDQQVIHKELQVRNAISKIGKQDADAVMMPIIGALGTKYYRNKLEFSFSNSKWKSKEEIKEDVEIENSNALGFHPPGFYNKIVDVETCFLQDDKSNKIRNAVRAYTQEHNITYYDYHKHVGMMRNMIVRNTSIGEWMLIMIFGEQELDIINDMMAYLTNAFPFINSFHYVINEKKNDSIFDQAVVHYSGAEWIHEKLGDIKYKISPKSFFQTNSQQAKVLYDEVVKFAKIQKTDHVYDLYTGLGSIALYVAKNCASVLGIEEIPVAIEDAKFNAEMNKIENAKFYAGDVKDILTAEFIAEHPKPDVIITDPPRAGMHQNVVDTLLTVAAPRIVYVSCNPATQARDIALLAVKYNVISLRPVDMFPHTHHVESIALLELK